MMKSLEMSHTPPSHLLTLVRKVNLLLLCDQSVCAACILPRAVRGSSSRVGSDIPVLGPGILIMLTVVKLRRGAFSRYAVVVLIIFFLPLFKGRMGLERKEV